MSCPFYYHAATHLTATQHPCRLSFAAAIVAALFLFTNPALANLDCKIQPTCAELGYSTELPNNCPDYILCPFDTTYKKCVGNPCERLGYTKDSKDWCEDYDLCPYDNSYTACTGILSYLCPDGYTDGLYISDEECQSAYGEDYIVDYFILQATGGSCGRCINPKTGDIRI